MRAEREVHNRVVAATCSEAASQYFLITPKLLLGLQYHPRMTVLCINNVSICSFVFCLARICLFGSSCLSFVNR